MKQRPPFDTRASWRSLSRRWRIVGAFLAVGLLAALAYTTMSPRRAVADSIVLLPPAPADGSGSATRDMGTEARIATSSPVLGMAIKATGVTMSIDELRQRVGASAVTSSLLDVKVEDTSPRRAVRLSNAVARGYVAYSKQQGVQSANTLAQSLAARASKLSEQLDGLDAQIADKTATVAALPPGSPAAASAAAERDALTSRRESVTQDLADVNQAIDTARLNGASQTEGLQVLEPATSASEPSLVTIALPFVFAVLVALAAGSATALWWDRRDDRARRRKDIATAIGAPVLASLQARDAASDPGEDRWGQASESDEQALRRLEQRLAHGEDAGRGFVVVSFSDDEAAIQVVRQLSAAAAKCGLRTALFAPEPCRPLDAPHAVPTRNASRPNPMIYDSHRTPDDTVSNSDFAIVLVTTDGAMLELPRWSASLPAVMIVSAGFARRDELASVSAMMREASGPFEGVIVTNPERRDDTSAWQAPTTEPELLPTRVTGVVREPAS
jgi:capsular polysaccharide biosynthesis protein